MGTQADRSGMVKNQGHQGPSKLREAGRTPQSLCRERSCQQLGCGPLVSRTEGGGTSGVLGRQPMLLSYHSPRAPTQPLGCLLLKDTKGLANPLPKSMRGHFPNPADPLCPGNNAAELWRPGAQLGCRAGGSDSGRCFPNSCFSNFLPHPPPTSLPLRPNLQVLSGPRPLPAPVPAASEPLPVPEPSADPQSPPELSPPLVCCLPLPSDQGQGQWGQSGLGLTPSSPLGLCGVGKSSL